MIGERFRRRPAQVIIPVEECSSDLFETFVGPNID
jgi:hypothetical protein